MVGMVVGRFRGPGGGGRGWARSGRGSSIAGARRGRTREGKKVEDVSRVQLPLEMKVNFNYC